jgi:hypothetical protein
MFTKLTSRILTGVVAAAGLTAVLVAPASAAEASNSATNAPAAAAAVPCSNFPGHYCLHITYTSVSGGIQLNSAHSTGYTTAKGSGHESVVYTCNAGLCARFATNNVRWAGRDVKLVAQHVGLSFFLPCGSQFGTAWLGAANPHVLAPGHPGNGKLQFRVTCGAKAGIQRIA